MKALIVPQHSAKTACLRKIWFSSYSQNWLLTNEISVFFNYQYFTNRLISDFGHVDRHGWKKQGLLTGFLKKKFSFGEMGHFGPKNSGSAERIFFKFCPVKGANNIKGMRITLIIFQQKFVWGKWTILGPKIVHSHNSGSSVRTFLNFA